MGYYNEVFIQEKNGKLKRLGACRGSDAPCYFEEVKSLKEFYEALEEVKEENGFIEHSKTSPSCFTTYQTSDEIIILVSTGRAWWEIWKPKFQVIVSAENHGRYNEPGNVDFLPVSDWRHYDGEEETIQKLANKFKTIYIPLPKEIKT